MGQNKKAAFRYRIIDQLLQNGHSRTIDEIRERVGEALHNEFGDEGGVSIRTLYYDFEIMREPPPRGFNAPIECKHGWFQYTEKGFSIFGPPIEEIDRKLVSRAITILEQMQYLPLVRELIAFLKDVAGTAEEEDAKPSKRLLFEQQWLASGLDKMDVIQKAVEQKKPLAIQYLPFYEDLPLSMELHPYLIKEYRNRWYVIGWEKTAGKIYHMALDRMVSAEIKPTHFITPPDHFNPATWFSDVIGVTIPEDTGIQKITFSVSPDSAPYIRTKPLHPSQQLEDKRPDGTMVFSLEVIPNFELEMVLLGYGENLEVLAPEWFREKIRERLENAVNSYQLAATSKQ